MSVMWVVAVLLAQQPDGAKARVDPFEPQEPLPVQRVPRPEAREVRPVDVPVPATIEVKSEMGKRFRLVEAIFLLDGTEVGRRTATKGQELERNFRAYDGSLRPGQHALTVTLVYEGRNTGPFTYLDNYKYRVESTHGFAVAAGERPATINVVAHERPGANLPLEQKPMLDILPAPGSAATATTPNPLPR